MKYIELTKKNLNTWRRNFTKDPDSLKKLDVGHFIAVDDSAKTYTLIHKDSLDDFKELLKLYEEAINKSPNLN